MALLAKAHNIPFYVAAPLSTFDMDNNEEDIVIEERSVDEVVKIGEKRIAPVGVRIFNPAFDVTSPDLIAGIITEKGVIYPPYELNLRPLFNLTNNTVVKFKAQSKKFKKRLTTH